MAEAIKGYLVIDVVEASGKSRDDAYVWDSTTFEGFVKGTNSTRHREPEISL